MTEQIVAWKAMRACWRRGTSRQEWTVSWGDYQTRSQARYTTLAEAQAHFDRLVVKASCR